ncbi:hypothetical protein ACQKWADRAFT_325762 [Trichoderma austrokoningii]
MVVNIKTNKQTNPSHPNVGLGQEQLNMSDHLPHIGDQNSTPYVLQPHVQYGVEDNAYASSTLYDQHNIRGSWCNDTDILQHNFASEHEINLPDAYQSTSSHFYQDSNLPGQISSIQDGHRNICLDIERIVHLVNHGLSLPCFENGSRSTCIDQIPEFSGSVVGESYLSANLSNIKTQPSFKSGDENTLQLKRNSCPVSTSVLPARKTALRSYVREQGVCIRCRLTGIQCSGDTPCTGCLLIGNPRIWIKPCTKAEFLDIIIDSSYFPDQYIFHQFLLAPYQLRNTFMPAMDVLFRLRHMKSSMTTYNGLVGITIRLSWRDITFHLYLCSWENYEFQNRIDFSLTSKSVMREYRCLKGRYLDRDRSKRIILTLLSSSIKFNAKIADSDLEFWSTLSKNKIADTHFSLWWLFVRAQEILFFFNLQRMCLNLYKLSQEELEDFITIVMDFLVFAPPFPSIRITALNRKSEYSFHSVSTATENNFIDQNRRIRMALWVYVSIAVRRLESWSSPWCGLHAKWPILCWKYFQQCFEVSESKSHDFENRFGKSLLQMALRTLSLHDTEWTPLTDDKTIELDTWRGDILAVDSKRKVYCILTSTQLNGLMINIDQLVENGTLLDGGDEVADEGESSISFSFI